MRRILGVTALLALTICPAVAADLPRPVMKAPVSVAPLDYWSGFYAGAHLGWNRLEHDWFFPTNAASAVNRPDGFSGGGQFGINWLSGNYLFGLEADASWTDLSATTVCPQATFACRTQTEWLAFATARLGFVAGPTLYYLKGGAVWSATEVAVIPLVAGTGSSDRHTLSGWTIGGGFEQAIGNGWSWKLEYNYMDFGSKVVNLVNDSDDLEQTGHRVILGVNYRFAGPTR